MNQLIHISGSIAQATIAPDSGSIYFSVTCWRFPLSQARKDYSESVRAEPSSIVFVRRCVFGVSHERMIMVDSDDKSNSLHSIAPRWDVYDGGLVGVLGVHLGLISDFVKPLNDTSPDFDDFESGIRQVTVHFWFLFFWEGLRKFFVEIIKHYLLM